MWGDFSHLVNHASEYLRTLSPVWYDSSKHSIPGNPKPTLRSHTQLHIPRLGRSSCSGMDPRCPRLKFTANSNRSGSWRFICFHSDRKWGYNRSYKYYIYYLSRIKKSMFVNNNKCSNYRWLDHLRKALISRETELNSAILRFHLWCNNVVRYKLWRVFISFSFDKLKPIEPKPIFEPCN